MSFRFAVDIKNYTPHAIKVHSGAPVYEETDGFITYESVGNIRLDCQIPEKGSMMFNGITVDPAPKFVGILGHENIPENCYILVSMAVGEYIQKHPDALPDSICVMGPNSGKDAVRFKDGPNKGQIDYVKGFYIYRDIIYNKKQKTKE